MNSSLLVNVKLGVAMFVAAYGNVVVDEVPPLVRTRFLIVIRPFKGAGVGVAVGVGVGVGVAVGTGVGVGVGLAPLYIEYTSLLEEPTPAFVTRFVVAAFSTA